MKITLKKAGKIVLEKKDVSYTFKNEMLNFQLEDMTHSLNTLTKEFTRENDEYSFFLDIENKNCEITLKKEQYYLQVKVEYAILLENKNIYEITYLLETDDEETKLIIELEGENDDNRYNQ